MYKQGRKWKGWWTSLYINKYGSTKLGTGWVICGRGFTTPQKINRNEEKVSGKLHFQ